MLIRKFANQSACLCAIALGCLISLPARAQTGDPFAGGPVANDPFRADPLRAGNKSESADGNPIAVRFRVIDGSDAPVAGAIIMGKLFRRRVVTDRQGEAVWNTTDQLLRRVSEGNRKPLQFVVYPPREKVLTKVVRRIPASELMKQTVLEFRASGCAAEGTRDWQARQAANPTR